jgi:hypothetical protein
MAPQKHSPSINGISSAQLSPNTHHQPLPGRPKGAYGA